MPTLMAIPLEIREKVLELVLTSNVTAASPDLNKSGSLIRSRSELSKSGNSYESKGSLRSWTGHKDIFFEPFEPQCQPVFLVNRKLSSESAVVLARLKKFNYVLDVILHNEVSLLPTWLLMPKAVSRVETLTCNFRVASACEYGKKSGGYRGFRSGDGAGPAIAWVIYGLLELFLLHGPTFGTNREIKESAHPKSYSRSIGILIINVETPPGIDPSHFARTPATAYRRRRQPERETQPKILSPKYLAGFIEGDLKLLLSMGYHTADYGDILYEHIGRIIIQLDGETQYDRDNWEILRDLEPTYPGASTTKLQRVRAFRDWKLRAIAKRSRSGLSIGDAEVNASLEHKSYRDCFDAASEG